MQTKRIRRRNEELYKFPFENDPDFQALSKKQKKFIFNIYMQPITGWIQRKCYQDAYDKYSYNDATADVHASTLIRHDKISPFISRIKNEYNRQLGVTVGRVLEEEISLAYSDIAKYITKNGYLKCAPDKLPKRLRRAISSIESVRKKDGSVIFKIALWNKGQSLQRLQNVLGMNAPTKTESKTEANINLNANLNVEIKSALSSLCEKEVCQLEELISKVSSIAGSKQDVENVNGL